MAFFKLWLGMQAHTGNIPMNFSLNYHSYFDSWQASVKYHQHHTHYNSVVKTFISHVTYFVLEKSLDEQHVIKHIE